MEDKSEDVVFSQLCKLLKVDVQWMKDNRHKMSDSLLTRNSEQQTPLSVSIRSSSMESVKALLDIGAASSIFVKGYAPESLVCSLPMALQPASSCFNHPEPLENLDPTILSGIDDAMVAYIGELDARSKAAARVLASKKKQPSSLFSTPSFQLSTTTAPSTATIAGSNAGGSSAKKKLEVCLFVYYLLFDF